MRNPDSAREAMADASFPKKLRILKKSDFDAVFAARIAASGPHIRIHARRNDLEWTRLGLVVSKRVGGAVARNRWKRLLREAFRLSRDEIAIGIDLVVIPQTNQPPRLVDLQRELASLAERVQRRMEKGAP